MIIFSIATLDDGTKYIGVFEQWFLINEEASLKEHNKAEKQIEMNFNMAVEMKTSLKYRESGNSFLKAAEGYVEIKEFHDAGRMYEEAYKVFSISKCTDELESSLLNAIQMFELNPITHDRAARHYETLANIYTSKQNLPGALRFYLKALNLAEAGRSWFVRVKVANLRGELKQYVQASAEFESLIKDGVKNQCTHLVLNTLIYSCLISLAFMDDFKSLDKKYKQIEAAYPSFTVTRESILIRKLIQNVLEQDFGEALELIGDLKFGNGEFWIRNGLEALELVYENKNISYT